MTETRAHDPFSAHSSTSGGFPGKRLSRAGVPDAAIANLDAWYAERSPEQQAEFRKSINSASDGNIAARFVAPEGNLEEQFTADQLHDLALAAGVPTSGTKAEVASRITEAQQAGEGEQVEGEGEQVEGEPPGGGGEQQGAVEIDGETVTGTIPASAAQEPAQGGDGQQQPAQTPAGPQEPAEAAPGAVPDPSAVQVAPQQAAPAERPRRRGGSGKDGQ